MALISNIPSALEWRVYKGDTAILTIAILDENEDALDLTGMTFNGELRINQEDEDSDRSLTISVNENILSIEIPDTATLPKTTYYDIQSIKDGIVTTILKGMVISEMDVTRL